MAEAERNENGQGWQVAQKLPHRQEGQGQGGRRRPAGARPKERRRWSFRRPAASASARDTSSATPGCHGKGQLASTSSHCFLEVHAVTVQDQHAVGAAAPHEVAITAATAPPEGSARDAEEAAAVKIQAAFRSYLCGSSSSTALLLASAAAARIAR
ncbi:hypothetical protein TRIUR3_01415 [Triticum urartu]|uniref:Uncharacterized protein n=1 Tax=Triticum urartu TaxID=4572 RepID=M7ZE81_TRIUA|nr:hypothetical protein TRIUR3_01415 [Triticum urartu]